MSHPYQCLTYCQQASHSETGIVVGASGSYIHTFNAQNGRYLSTWPSLGNIKRTRSISPNFGIELGVPHLKSSPEDDSERPSKRQKLYPIRDESGSSSAEIVLAGDCDSGESSSWQQPLNSPIIKLAATFAGQYVVAVTGEDKCIRVFHLAADGTLTQFSERQDSTRRLPCSTY